MGSLRQVGAGILLGVISIIVILGGFSLALVEGGALPAASAASPTLTPTPAISSTLFPTLSVPSTNTPQIIQITDTPSITPTSTSILPTAGLASLTPASTLTICPPPAGWLPIVVRSYDTLTSLAQTYHTSVDLLRTKNCLLNDQLVTGSILYVPSLLPSATFMACGAPAGWVYYTVLPGDTLYHISQLYRVSVNQLMQANCMRTTNINVGQRLRVPNVATSTPPASDTPLPTVTEMPSALPSDTSAPDTSTPTATNPPPTASATATPTTGVTNTATVTATPGS